ncbi:phage tail spike protein [Schaalia sp. lx-260]|uniref:phage tail spike protein n=1 Tax=Schaalia sp. lx-260 TaxID=2899082 RepID=UPI001E49AFFB|nr:phage tail spike protein [Schaalia sp. lx-260]MCD4549176.1 phage tail protein [Schaalia sp. lx-260]
MITTHPANAIPKTDVTTDNGLAVLDAQIINPVVTEELGGTFALEFDYPLTAKGASSLQVGNLVRCPAPVLGGQFFRIHHCQTNEHHQVHVTAQHVFYDLAANLLMDTNLVNEDANGALTRVLAGAQFKHPFTATSNLSTRASPRLVRVSVASVLMDPDLDNGIVNRWGGELIRNNTHISLVSKRGADNGVQIRAGKNLLSMTASVDYSTVVTRIVPVGFDGLMLPEKWVDSRKLDQYPHPRVGVIKFDHIKSTATPNGASAEDALPPKQAENALRQAAKQQFALQRIDEPTRTWTVNLIDLAGTKEYAHLRALESVAIGDVVTVKDLDAGVDVSARVVAYQYNPLTEGYTQVTLGSFTPRITSQSTRAMAVAGNAMGAALDASAQAGAVTTVAGDAMARADQAFASVGEVSGRVDEALMAANGKNRNHYGSATPKDPRPGDVWFKTNGEKQEIWIYEQRNNRYDWFPIATDLTYMEAKQRLDETEAAIAEAKDVADAAIKAGTEVRTRVRSASRDAEKALLKAQEAVDKGAENAKLVEDYQIVVGSLLEGARSKITQLSSAVNLRVEKDQVINQINISREDILIDGTKVHITGQTTIDQAVITGAMIKDGTIDSAKIASLDAGKITTATLAASRIGARSISADKLATNAIQVGLSGWSQSIRISPTEIRWYNGNTLTGKVSSSGLQFYYDTKYIGQIGEAGFKNKPESVKGLNTMLSKDASYAAWTYGAGSNDHVVLLTLDPKGSVMGARGLHLGIDLHLGGNKIMTTGKRGIKLLDSNVNRTMMPAWCSENTRSQVAFSSGALFLVTDNNLYSVTQITKRLNEVIMRVNHLITYLNKGWVQEVHDIGGGRVAWSSYKNTGLSTMSTNLT